ncbi:hypothetical protein IJ22_00910 [Paenibacillus naphthalenovorans]|uniref:Uncharacterized protein n=1 Tax=Paenibacillus naphthalenovorans TaxID=162209 RepID=A0A0U2VA71_9BACL|nr:hypothetical protein IJ22_00910 [Paenibacillus naphthalenovorans]
MDDEAPELWFSGYESEHDNGLNKFMFRTP